MSGDKNIRKKELGIGGITMPLPCFFPSISTVKNNLPILEYLQILTALHHPLFLISAYDLYKCKPKQFSKANKLLDHASKNNQIVLLDSGNYESYWKNDSKWSQDKYRKILGKAKHHLAFCFDSLQANGKIKKIVSFVENQVLQDQEYSLGTVIPILHSARTKDFPQLVSYIVDKLNPFLVAVPERQLGEGIGARAETVNRIRKELNKKKAYYPLHLLGTGNPLSILIYSICGADSFDGLEWCQTAADHRTSLLYHFQQRDFFGEQTVFCKMKKLPYTQATLAHNLDFYSKWMYQIQTNFADGTINYLMKKYLPEAGLLLLKQRIPELFNGC
jgi:queuine/archaeosine tRNA-ribosyltransferase